MRWLPIVLSISLIVGCGSQEIKPVDVYAEDMCSQCRMAISDLSFASEIISQQGDVFKFDDIGCMLAFREKSADLKIGAIFLKDYFSRTWIPYQRSTIVQTNVKTPMGSGKAAFADSLNAKEFASQHPMTDNTSRPHGCCSGGTE